MIDGVPDEVHTATPIAFVGLGRFDTDDPE